MSGIIKTKISGKQIIDGSVTRSNLDTSIVSDIDTLKSHDTQQIGQIAQLQTDVAAETSARISGDSALDLRIDGVVDDLDAEVSRATSAEDAIQAAVDAVEVGAGLSSSGSYSPHSGSNYLKSSDFLASSLVESLHSADKLLDVAIKAEVDARIADVNAEETRALAAESALQSQIDSLESGSGASFGALEARVTTAEGEIDTLQSELAAEITRATSAEGALDLRLDVLEQDPTTKSYVDQKVSDLVNSAPAVLDTLKELADALGGDANFATTVANNIGTVSANLASEVTRATAAEGVLQSNIDAEALARTNADSALDVRVTALETFQDAQVVYVAKNGNDSTGNGGEHKPFLTLTAALNAITDASPTKRYVIRIKAGSYTESGVVNLKPNVYVVGDSIYSVRITATSFALHSSFTGSSDHRSGFSSCTLLSACDFNWQTVTSAAGKLYFTEVQFGAAVSMYGHNNAIAQAQFLGCIFFGTFTVSGINVGVHRNNIHYGNITLNQHPNGGMATILAADGGVCTGTVAANATTDNFGRRCSIFARSFYMEYLTVNGPSAYCDITDNSVPRDIARVTKSNGGNIVYINTLTPIDTNSRNHGDVGKQYLYNFNYVNASTGTDLYVISMGTAFAADNAGKNIFIEADSYGLNANVNGGDVNVKTAAVSGTGVRGKIKLDGKEVDVTSTKIVNLAAGVASTDAVNKGQLDALSAASSSNITALETRVTTAEGEIDTLQSGLAAEITRATSAEGALDSRLDVLEQDPTTKAYVDQKVADLVNSAPAVLDTLKELADALGGDANFATTVSNNIGTVASNLAAEISRATAAETALQAEIDAEEVARAAADSALSSRVTALESVSSIVREKPVGDIDGVNKVFTLAKTPNANSEMVFLNGLLQEPGVSADYQISGKIITFAVAPVQPWNVLVTYLTVE